MPDTIGESEGGPLALSWSKPSDDSLKIRLPQTTVLTMTVVPMKLPVTTSQMGESTTDSQNHREIAARMDTAAAGLTNPDGTRMKKDETAASQMIGESIATRADVRVIDSISTRNGKGMGSGSGRPLPSTHLSDGGRD